MNADRRPQKSRDLAERAREIRYTLHRMRVAPRARRVRLPR